MNRLSTAGFFPPSVYIGFRLFVLLGRRSRDVFSMLWRVRGRIVPLAHSSVGEQSCPTPPRHPAVRSVATRPWYVRVLDSTNCSPGGKTVPRARQGIVDHRPGRPSEARTNEILFKPMGEQSPWLTTGLRPVYPRSICGTMAALRSWLLTSGPTPVCPSTPFSCKACPGECKAYPRVSTTYAHSRGFQESNVCLHPKGSTIKYVGILCE